MLQVNMINKDLRQHLIMHDVWEAFLGNVDNHTFTRLSSSEAQLLHAFNWKLSAEGEPFWRNLYFKMV